MGSWSKRRQKQAFFLVASLKKCAEKKDLYEGIRLHAKIRMSGLLAENAYLGSTLISMFAKCGALSKAQKVLHELPEQSICTWNALLSGYTQQGLGKDALECFHEMRTEGLSPDAFTYACALKACGITKEVELGEQIHEEIFSQGLLGKDIVLGNTLVDMYTKCGVLTKAQEVLDKLPIRDVVSWTALIAGYAQQGQSEKAMTCYDQMLYEGLSPNAITYACIVKAYGIAKEVSKGQKINEEIASLGLLGKDGVLDTALVDMYAKFGMLTKAQEVLDKLPHRNVDSWNVLIAGYVQLEWGEMAMASYGQMRHECISPNAITYTCILKTCGLAKEIQKGKQIDVEIASQGLVQKDVVLGTVLIDMYAKCGMLTRARKALDELPVRDVVLWNTLIVGYTQQEESEKAMVCYDQMQDEGLSPDAITYACILKAYGSAKEVDKGKKIHEEIASQGLLGNDIVLGNSLVDMYAKCSMLSKAQEILDELPVRDVVSWNALMAGFAQEGRGEEAKHCFERMQNEGLAPDTFSWNTLIGGYAQQGESEKALAYFLRMQHEGIYPDSTTLLCVLNACSHSGLVDEGERFYKNMEVNFGITPDMEHHVCMVDLFGRTGHLDKAIAVIEKVRPSNYLAVWSAVLGACRKWENVKLGRLAFEHAVEIDEYDAGMYVCMENIYAAAGMREEELKI